MTAEITDLPPRDPIFALAPELKLHLSKLDGRPVVNSREVARVYFHGNHRQLLRHIMRSIWNHSMRPTYEDEFRQCPDGTIDITPEGLTSALCHWGFHHKNKRLHEFQHRFVKLITGAAKEIEAQTGINPLHQKMEEFFGPVRHFTRDGHQCCDDCKHAVAAGPMLHDELWATIAEKHAFLCFDCTEQRLERPLTQADLIPCPFNAGWLSFDGADVAAMQFARGRRLLPERPS